MSKITCLLGGPSGHKICGWGIKTDFKDWGESDADDDGGNNSDDSDDGDDDSIEVIDFHKSTSLVKAIGLFHQSHLIQNVVPS